MKNKDNYKSLFNMYSSKVNIYDNQIKLDVNRTFNDLHFYKNKINKHKLFIVLRVLACDNKEIGYTQGLNYIAGYFLMKYKGDKIKTFKIMTILLKNDKYGLYDLYRDGFPKLFLAKYQIIQLIKKYLPNLYNYFLQIKLDTLLWLSSWLLTLFSNNLEHLDIKQMDVFYNLYLQQGWLVIIKFTIFLLQQNEKHLLSLDSYEILIYLNNRIWKNVNLNNIENKINDMNITNKKLYYLEIDYIKKINKNNKRIKLFNKITSKQYIKLFSLI